MDEAHFPWHYQGKHEGHEPTMRAGPDLHHPERPVFEISAPKERIVRDGKIGPDYPRASKSERHNGHWDQVEKNQLCPPGVGDTVRRVQALNGVLGEDDQRDNKLAQIEVRGLAFGNLPELKLEVFAGFEPILTVLMHTPQRNIDHLRESESEEVGGIPKVPRRLFPRQKVDASAPSEHRRAERDVDVPTHCSHTNPK
jgi:hypothetical protein